jgi:hypothetical protein
MSLSGHGEKNSRRAYLVCISPITGNPVLRVSLRKTRYEHIVSACAPMRDICLGNFGVLLERQNADPRTIGLKQRPIPILALNSCALSVIGIDVNGIDGFF